MTTQIDLNEQLPYIRGKIATVNAQIDEIRGEKYSEADAKAAIDQFIESSAQKFDSCVGDFMQQRTNHIQAGFFVDSTKRHEDAPVQVDVAPAMCAIFPEQVREYLYSQLTEQHAGSFGRPVAERPAALAKLEQERFELELQEERLVRKIEQLGTMPNRRRDIENVLIVVMKDEFLQENAA